MPGVLKLEGTNIATGDGNGAVTLSSGINFPFDGTTDSGRIIQVKSLSSQETNNLSASFTARWNFSITLKSSTSKVLVFHTENPYTPGNNGYGCKIYRDDSVINDSITTFPSGTNSALVYDTGTKDSSNDVHAIYAGSGGMYTIVSFIFLDDVSSNFNAGDTVYYGNFYQRYHGDSNVVVPTSASGTPGFFRTILMEVQK